MRPRTVFEVRRQANEPALIDRVLGYRAFQVEKFVRAYFAEHGVMPIYRTICTATGIRSKGEISRIIRSLERRGIISRQTANSHRPILVINGLPS